ncbi:MAG: hypothetical protein AAGD25_06135 [Cyanobacteria bacterium P01_F01_bin.150]
MAWYAQWFGDWSRHRQSYRWQKLGGGHRALDDCQTTLKRLVTMARISMGLNPDEIVDWGDR